MRIGNGLIASMEDIDNNTPVDESEAAATAVAVADDSAEVQAEGDEIGVSVSEVEDAVQAGEELEDIADVAVAAVETGEGLDEPAAELASIAVESIMNRLGVRNSVRLVPATESFGNSNTRLSSTKLIVETIGDQLKKIWQAIKQAALRLWDKIKSFFAKLFNSAAMLVKHIAGLTKRANEVTSGLTPKEKMIKSGVAKMISIGGKANKGTFDEIVKDTQALMAASAKISQTADQISMKAVVFAGNKDLTEATVAAFIKEDGVLNEQIKSTVDSAFTAVSSGVSAAPREGSAGGVFYYGHFANGESLCVTSTVSGESNSQTTKRSVSFVGLKGKELASEMDALDIGGIKAVLKSAGDIATRISDYKKVEGLIDKNSKGIAKLADTIMSNAGKALDKSGSEATRTALTEMKNKANESIGLLNTFGNKAPALSFNIAKAGADYASLSLANLKEAA